MKSSMLTKETLVQPRHARDGYGRPRTNRGGDGLGSGSAFQPHPKSRPVRPDGPRLSQANKAFLRNKAVP